MDITVNRLSYPFVLGYVPLGDGICGNRDIYDQKNEWTLGECMEQCMKNAECSAITYKEGLGGCGIHEGAIEIVPNSDSGGWPTGYSCYAKQGKVAKQS